MPLTLSMLGYLSIPSEEMANARASFHAARMSLQKLFGDVRDETLFNRVDVAKFVYLWTLTTPDVCEPAEVLKRWSRLTKDWKGFKAFRVLEKHPKGHGWHIHFVSVDRYDVNQVRKRTTRHGFGRIHVLKLPAERAAYCIKYLVKALREQTGRRLWACVGYKGVRSADVIIEDTFWHEVFSGHQDHRFSVGDRRQKGLKRLYSRLFNREAHEIPKKMDSKHSALLIERINKGAVVTVAEYRGTRVDSVSFAVKNNPSQKEERVILRHAIEIGNLAATVVEWTPQGTSKESVRMTLKKGQMVLVDVKKMFVEKGNTELSGELVPLS